MPHAIENRAGAQPADAAAARRRHPDTGLSCLALIARYHRVAADCEQLHHQFGTPPAPLGPTALLRAARHLQLKARRIALTCADELAGLPLPAIALLQDGRCVVIAGLANGKVLVHDPLERRPLSLPLALFREAWSGDLILLTRRRRLGALDGRFDISWFVPALARYRRQFGEVLLASFMLQLLALLTPLFFQVVVDKVLVHKSLTTLNVLALGLLVAAAFEVLMGGLRSWLFAHTTNRVDVALGARLFNHLLALPASYFQARRVGDTIARVRELEGIRQFITGSALTLIIDLCFAMAFLVVMFAYSPRLTAIVGASIPCYVAMSLTLTPLLRRRLQEKFQRGAENQAFLVEAVSGIETLKAMAVEPHIQRRWEDQLAGYVSAAFAATSLGNIASQLAALVNKVVTVLILWVGATLVMAGDLSVGQLIAFNMLAGRISAPILRLVQLWQDFQQAGISVARLGDILNSPTEPGHDPNRTTLPPLKGHIRLERVSFGYHPDRPDALDGVELDIPAGQVLGLVGRSGSGKSTLAGLVLRLQTPQRGRLLIDGVDTSLVPAAWLRRQIGVVQQESFLFNRSVRDNIALGEPGADMAAVIAAAKLADAHDFILELPQGYDTPVGERGAVLSGGQRQRVAIARALLTDPRILIFDEATSALDYESEQRIQQNMRLICRDRTVLIIAHRLSTVRQADRIAVLDNGRIIESGTHQQLIHGGGLYARLHSHQIGQHVA